MKLLSEEIHIFRYGRRNSYSGRRTPQHHRISSSPTWYAWADRVKSYPGMITYKDYTRDESYDYYIGEVGSGKGRDGPQILLWRYATKLDEELYSSWYLALEDDTEKSIIVQRTGLEHLAMFQDTEFGNYIKRIRHSDVILPNLCNQEQQKEEETEMPCKNGCRRSFCYCDDKVTYEINEHSMTIDIEKNCKTIRITLEEANELASFLGSAKEKIKEAKIAAIKQQQDDLAKQLSDIQNI